MKTIIVKVFDSFDNEDYAALLWHLKNNTCVYMYEEEEKRGED